MTSSLIAGVNFGPITQSVNPIEGVGGRGAQRSDRDVVLKEIQLRRMDPAIWTRRKEKTTLRASFFGLRCSATCDAILYAHHVSSMRPDCAALGNAGMAYSCSCGGVSISGLTGRTTRHGLTQIMIWPFASRRPTSDHHMDI